MRNPWPLFAVLLLSSCGAYQWFGKTPTEGQRQVASLAAQQLAGDREGFGLTLQEKLEGLHSYYLIGQKNLEAFDAALADAEDLASLYESDTYSNLLAVRTQTDEIEEELKELWKDVGTQKSGLFIKLSMRSKIQKYAERSPYAALAMENLMSALQIAPTKAEALQKNKLAMKKDLEAELKAMESSKDFAVYEKNVEHLSQTLEVKTNVKAKRFLPSKEKTGNLFGGEFPSKVWSLTFDDGPKPATTATILKALKERRLKATFFMLTQSAKVNLESARALRDAGMEIASHSWDHQQLNKAGPLVLEKQITGAIGELEKLLNVDVRYFRLPYGAGVNMPHVREKIAENNVVHVFWNVDTLDWMPQEPKKIVNRTLAIMKAQKNDAGIILMHDIHARTAAAAPQIMDYLKKDGRRVCTIGEIVSQLNEGVETVCPAN